MDYSNGVPKTLTGALADFAPFAPKHRVIDHNLDAAAFRSPHLASLRFAQEFAHLFDRRHAFPGIAQHNASFLGLAWKLADLNAPPPKEFGEIARRMGGADVMEDADYRSTDTVVEPFRRVSVHLVPNEPSGFVVDGVVGDMP